MIQLSKNVKEKGNCEGSAKRKDIPIFQFVVMDKDGKPVEVKL